MERFTISLDEDLARRDFTINALYYDPTKDVVVDFMGGLKDVEKRTLRLIGTADDKASVMSFVLAGYTTEEVGQALNDEGIAVRTGHHCAQPILRRFGLEATVRPSLAFYNTCEEVDRMVQVVRRLAGARTR